MTIYVVCENKYGSKLIKAAFVSERKAWEYVENDRQSSYVGLKYYDTNLYIETIEVDVTE